MNEIKEPTHAELLEACASDFSYLATQVTNPSLKVWCEFRAAHIQSVLSKESAT